jgi:hypothetical protein
MRLIGAGQQATIRVGRDRRIPIVELLCRVSNPIFYRAKGTMT